MVNIADISLVTQVAVLGNRRAFDKLVVKYQSPVRRFFLHQTGGDSQLSDDLAQDTFIKAYTNIRQFRGTAQFSTWLMRIAYNVFYDYKRSESRRGECGVRSEDTLVADISHSTLHTPHSSTLKMDLYAALALLKPGERECITLQLIDGYPVNEISKITGIPENTVKSHLRRGKDKMANYLRQNGYDR